MESQQLLTQSEVLEDEIFASTKDAAKPAEEVPEPHDHGKNLIRRRQSADRIVIDIAHVRCFDERQLGRTVLYRPWFFTAVRMRSIPRYALAPSLLTECGCRR